MQSATQAKAVPTNLPATAERQGLVQWAAGKFGVDAGKVFPILKQTCFKAADRDATDAEVAALMIVAREHGLNPFLKEIYAFPDKKGGIVPVVGVDGWISIVNAHPAYDGVTFAYEKDSGSPAWIECHIFRKDRSHPIVVREFFSECRRETGPWKSHPTRMLRHKAFIQAARVAFGFAGIYDEDEAERIVEGSVVHEQAQGQPQRGAAALKNALMSDGLNVEQKPEAKQDAPQGKVAGSLELLQKYLGQFPRCTESETLSLARDEANMYEWAPEDRDALDTAYSKRQSELEKL